ncbi:hypothetical protein [Mesorhizobium sp. M1365]|uniref:ImmA/IrrE family metallo-endopeptidase n=1 Tax=Mesorhizobium sp. M1365 TaxID=2957090 RepID=UPI00333629B5
MTNMQDVKSWSARHWRRIFLGMAAFLGVVALWFGGNPNPWSDPEHLAKVDVELDQNTRADLERELRTLARVAGITAPVALNKPFDPVKLNIHIVRGDLDGRDKLQDGDARYDAGWDVLLLSTRVVRPMVPGLEYANVHLSTDPQESLIAQTWFQFVVLHELGHRTLHRYVAVAKDVAEQQADKFAFEHLAELQVEQAGKGDDPNLFSPQLIAGLPPADRRIAVTASTLTMLSVGLQFSDVAFSTFFSDPAHDAFVKRFVPYLTELLLRTTTFQARTIVQLALAYLDRVRLTGESVVAEIHLSRPIGKLFYENGQVIVVADDKELNWARIDLPSPPYKTSAEGTGPAVIDVASWTKGNPPAPAEAEPSHEPPDPQELTRMLMETSGKAPAGVEFPRCDDVQSVPAEGSSLLLGFYCNFGLFGARYDTNAKTLSGLHQFNWTQKFLEQPGAVFPANGDASKGWLVIDTASDGKHDQEFALKLYELGQSPPKLVNEEPLVADTIPNGTSALDWFRISHPPVLSCDRLSANLITCLDYIDARFFFDVEHGVTLAVVYPASAYIAGAGEGRFIFYVPGGYHVFLIQLGVR